MKQFNLSDYLNSINELTYPNQDEFTNAQYWQKNIIKDSSILFNVPNIILGKKYYVDWTKVMLSVLSQDEKNIRNHNQIKQSGIGEIIFNEIIFNFKHGIEIFLKGVCCTKLGISNFKITLPIKWSAEIKFEKWNGRYYFNTDIYEDMSLSKKVFSKGVVENGIRISYNKLASAILKYSFDYNVCVVNGMNTITTCAWNGVGVIAVTPDVIENEIGFSISNNGDFKVYGNHQQTHNIDDYETKFMPYNTFQKCVDDNRIKFTRFEDFETEKDNTYNTIEKSISGVIIIKGKVKFFENIDSILIEHLIGLD